MSQGQVTETAEPVQEVPAHQEWREAIVPGRFLGKTVVVTGAGSGIGKATASRVARGGGQVIAVDVSTPRLQVLAEELRECDVETVVGDVREATLLNRVVEIADGTIDCLANIAGVMDNFTPLHEMSDEVWDRVMGVNLVGMMRLCRAVLPVMLAQGHGTIVNVGSEASIKASAAGTAYTTSKHAVVGLSKSIAFMYGPHGIRTNVVAPGGVITNIEAKFESAMGSERVNHVLATMPSVASAEQLASLIAFLLSDESTNINGAVIPSDGGWSVQ
ncbi:MAG: SDR family NAD(P)-dependent oxidoreductase [Acidimicrobiales bacterium]